MTLRLISMDLRLILKMWRSVRMANELVGLENLPNAFIKQIKLTDYSQKSFEVSVVVNVKDAIDDGDYIWSSDPIMAPLVNVGLISLTDSNLISQLSEGTLSPLDKSLKQFTKTLAVKDKVPSSLNVNYNHIFREVHSNSLANLTIFAFCFINERIKNYGPIKSEKIIENFQIADRTTIFRLPDSSLWAGPVHEHEGQYMAGSRHTTQYHPILTAQVIKNFKIKNLTSKLQKPPKPKEPMSSPISGLYESIDEDTNVTGMFSINIKNILMNNTKYGRFLHNASLTLYNEILKKFSIKSLIIQRQRVNLDNKKHIKFVMERQNVIHSFDNSLGIINNFTKVKILNPVNVILKDLPSSTSVPNMDPKKIYRQQITDENILSEIKEIFIGTSNNLRHFSFIDYSKRNTDPGNYRYKVFLEFYDPTLELIKSINDTMVKDLSSLKTYLEYKMRRSNYDYKNNESKIDNYATADLSEIINNYSTYFSYIDEISISDRRKLVDTLYCLVSPKNSTVSDTKRFVEKYEELHFQLFNSFDYDDKKNQNKVGRFGLKNNSFTNRIKVNKLFNKTFTPSDNYKRINYLNNQTAKGLKVFTKQQYNVRIQQEISKFFSSSPNFNTGENSSLQPSVLDALSNISYSSTQFLSPTSISVASVSQDTSRIENINIEVTNKLLRKKSLLKRSNKFSIKKIVNNDTADTSEQFMPIGDVIGTSTSQASYSENESSENEPPIKLLAALKLKDTMVNLNSKILRKQDFDISSPSYTLNHERSLKLPIQIKALLGSKLNSTNNSLLNSTIDAISSPQTRNIINLNFLGVLEVQYLKGYGLTSKGYLDMSNPIWNPLTQDKYQSLSGPIICRLIQYNNASLGVSVEVSKVMNIVDELFVISDQNLGIKPSLKTDNFIVNNSIQDVATYEYTNSNVVVQSNEVPIVSSRATGATQRVQTTRGSY